MSLTRAIHQTVWFRDPSPRLLAHWRFKLIACLAIVVGFFTFYFLLLNHPLFPAHEVPVTALDRLVPFQPGALLLYASLFLYIMLPSWLLRNRRDLIICCTVVSALCLAGLIAFFLCPTSLSPSYVYVDPARHPIFASLVSLDKPRNVFPSLHAAFAIFSALFIHRMAPRLGSPALVRAVSWSWCVAILYSTLATRQHVVLDLLAGTLLGALWASSYLHFFPPEPESPV